MEVVRVSFIQIDVKDLLYNTVPIVNTVLYSTISVKRLNFLLSILTTIKKKKKNSKIGQQFLRILPTIPLDNSRRKSEFFVPSPINKVPWRAIYLVGEEENS
jgi:hypothetical protein